MRKKGLFLFLLFFYSLNSNSQHIEKEKQYELKIGQKFKIGNYNGILKEVNKVEKIEGMNFLENDFGVKITPTDCLTVT